MQQEKKGRTNSDINPLISIKCVAPNQYAIYIFGFFFFLMNFIEIWQINVLYLQAFNKSYCLWIKYSYQHQENKTLITQDKHTG